MKRMLALVLCLTFCLGGCGLRLEKVENVPRETFQPVQTEPLPEPQPEPVPEPQPEPEPEPTEAELRLLRAQEILDTMTLEQKIGQLFFARCPGPNGDGEGLMAQYQLGGYLLFKRDFQDAAGNWLTAEQLTARLETYADAAAIAPFFGVDEEGGTVTRASQNPNLFPEGKLKSPQKLFSEGGLEAISQDAKYKSETLLQYGINVNFAPVADVTANSGDFMYPRAFGQDAAATADYVETVTAAMEQTGMGAVLKHFPGYGSNRDTHTDVVVDDRPYAQFTQSDFLPFQAGMTHENAAVLVSHNMVNAMDNTLPASLSPAVYRILREELGFTGVALTDDLIMDALSAYTADGKAAVMAIQAGADMVVSSDFEKEITQVVLALENDELSVERIEQSVLRVLQWKLLLGILV